MAIPVYSWVICTDVGTNNELIDNNTDDMIDFSGRGGTALDDGDKVSSASGAGDYIHLIGESSAGWLTLTRSGTWTDGS